MNDVIRNKYEVMMAASGRLKEAATLIGLDGRDFQSEAALEDAAPEPTDGNWVTNPLGAMHMDIAAQIRGPYRDALRTVDEFIKAASDQVEEIAINVKKSAEEYLAREESAVQDFNRLRGELDEEPR